MHLTVVFDHERWSFSLKVDVCVPCSHATQSTQLHVYSITLQPEWICSLHLCEVLTCVRHAYVQEGGQGGLTGPMIIPEPLSECYAC